MNLSYNENIKYYTKLLQALRIDEKQLLFTHLKKFVVLDKGTRIITNGPFIQSIRDTDGKVIPEYNAQEINNKLIRIYQNEILSYISLTNL